MSLPLVRASARAGGSRFAELSACLGPEQIGVTGDNSYLVLYGRPYAVLLDAERRLRLFRGSHDGGAFVEVTSGIPTALFGPVLPASVRRVSCAFDQSARIIVAYEEEGVVKVTRWDATAGSYVQNVSFAGVDPQLLMDATLADPRGYPSGAWSVREAFLAGIPVLFEWLPEPAWDDSAIPYSDVLIFYLTPDRLGVRARVQRQLYQTVQVLHDYAEPVVMDRAQALAGRYQLLVSGAATGEPLPDMLISDPYISDYLISPRVSDAMAAGVAPEGVRVENDTTNVVDDDELAASVAPEAIAVVADTYPHEDVDELKASVAPEDVAVVAEIYPVEDVDELDAAVAPETPIEVVTTTVPVEDDDALDATVSPETIRVQTV